MPEIPLKHRFVNISIGVLVASMIWIAGLFLGVGKVVGNFSSGGTDWQKTIQNKVIMNSSELSIRKITENVLKEGISDLKTSVKDIDTALRTHIQKNTEENQEIYRSLGRIEAVIGSFNKYSLLKKTIE